MYTKHMCTGAKKFTKLENRAYANNEQICCHRIAEMQLSLSITVVWKVCPYGSLLISFQVYIDSAVDSVM